LATAICCIFVLLSGAGVADETRMLADELANTPGRSDEDKARDVQRRPAQVLMFLGLRAGDTALDVWASGGWYTEVLSIAVGPDGRVYSQNAPQVLQFRDGLYDSELSARLDSGRLGNVVRLDEELASISLLPGTVDFVITALNFHDVYNRQGAEVADAFLSAILELLKPGGTLGLIDHVGAGGTDNTALHRIEPALARAAAADAGFIVEAESDLLAHPEDDHSTFVFDSSVHGETDRFILRLRKPE
jgi:predicted methyltransferase